jgi:hypothetical protein
MRALNTSYSFFNRKIIGEKEKKNVPDAFRLYVLFLFFRFKQQLPRFLAVAHKTNERNGERVCVCERERERERERDGHGERTHTRSHRHTYNYYMCCLTSNYLAQKVKINWKNKNKYTYMYTGRWLLANGIAQGDDVGNGKTRVYTYIYIYV